MLVVVVFVVVAPGKGFLRYTHHIFNLICGGDGLGGSGIGYGGVGMEWNGLDWIGLRGGGGVSR